MKDNWIKSGITFINDILVEYGGISEYKIIAKLRHKTSGYLNWIFWKKSHPKTVEIDSDNTRFNKNSSNSKNYAKLAKYQIQNVQIKKTKRCIHYY